jgi:hypothetical protein
MSWSLDSDTDSASSHALSFGEVEQLLVRAYARLIFTPKDSRGLRTAIVAQFCSLEVRITELSDPYISQHEPPYWVEIYSRGTSSLVDSCGFLELDEDELSRSVNFIIQAKQLWGIYH